MANWLQSILKRRAKLFGSHPRVARRLGHLWLIDPTDLLDLRLWSYRDIEPEARSKLIELGRRAEATLFFDIGANAGSYAIFVAEALPAITKVHAYEPSRSTHAKLVANIWLNKLGHKIEPHRIAIGDVEGAVDFHTPVGVSGGASVDLAAADKGGGVETETVRLRPFDALWSFEGRRLLFKIDVETTEDKALAGMVRTLRANECVLQLEIWKGREALMTGLFAELGYRRLGAVRNDVYYSNIEGLAYSSANAP